MSSRTILDFYYPGDILSIFDSWAQTEGFRLLSDEANKRTYQKGYGLMVMPTKVEISQNNGSVHLEAWIHNQLFTRILTLFLTPTEMKLESGGFMFIVPRGLSRGTLNTFLHQIGQPLLK